MITSAVSLFSGIGGFDLAMERQGINVAATVEWDKHAQKVLTQRFPKTKLYGDIQGVTGGQLIDAGFDPANGIITGGFPCQDLSVAGRRAGLAGNRSGLFWEICRLLKETQTQSFILENVPGLLSSNNGRDMGVVIRALEECGYSVAWRVLDAQYFGVAQRRRRVFIIGHLGNDWRTLAKVLDIAEGSRGYIEKSATKKQRTSYKTADGIRTSNLIGQPFVKIIRSGARAEDGSLPAEVWAERETAPPLNLNDLGDSRTAVLAVEPTFFYAKNHQGVRIQEKVINTLAATMGTGGGNTPMVAQEKQGSTVRRLTPVECERLQGFPDNWTEGQADSHRYKQLGNAVAVPVVEWIIKRFKEATN